MQNKQKPKIYKKFRKTLNKNFSHQPQKKTITISKASLVKVIQNITG